MLVQYVHLAVWLLALFSICGIVLACVARFVLYDSMAYDQLFVWRRKLPPEVTKRE
ncbi:hypothetical protein ACFO9Q_16610 [Paenibacillus sp. GCM10023252]|uniref:hypothetical protein n=1 Tax=Paenibacillus sp. GCM10023252 TaxID=3252649 RepID=UPI0036212A6A